MMIPFAADSQFPGNVNFNLFENEELLLTVPSTKSQQEIWIPAHLGEHANCAFNLSYSLRLTGELRISTLRSAIGQLIDRHKSLRMIFSEDGNTLNIFKSVPLSFQAFDLAELDSEAKAAQLAAMLAQEVSQPFQIEGGLLFRAKIVKLDLEIHQLILTAHQLICDDRSWRVMITDLGQIYSALLAGVEPHLPPLDADFSQYAIATAAAVEQPAEQYWLEQFAQSIPTLDLPTDRPRPRQRTFDAGCEVWQLSPQIAGGLQDLATRLESELKTLLLASWEIWLYRLTGQDDLVIGVPADGAVKFGCPNLVGNCVNLLPIRSAIDGTRPFRHYLQARSLAVSAAYAHQEFSLGSLIGKLPLKRDASRLPLVAILFDVDRGLDLQAGAFAGLVVECFGNPHCYENFEMSMKVTQVRGGLTLACQYNSNLFDRATIQRRLAEFETLLGGVVANPNCSIDLLPLLPTAELELLAAWNQTTTSESIERTIHELFSQQAAQTPGNVAVIFEDRQLTYQQLDRLSNQYAHHLQSLGVTAGSLVGISLERSIDMLVAMLGVLKAGGAYVPLDPSYPQHRTAYTLADCQAAVLITHEYLLDVLPCEQVQVVCVDRDAEILNTYPTDRPSSLATPTDLAYIIYTSGSTGNPKGVQIEHRSAANLLISFRQQPGLTTADTLLAVTTISFDMSVVELFLPLITGATLLIVSREVTIDGEQLLDALNNSNPTVMQATPATWRLLLASGWQGSPQLTVFCGGEPMTRNLADRLLERCGSLWNMYGPTEITVYSTIEQVEPGSEPILIGDPIANTQHHILDAHLQPLPIGIAGDFYIGGEGLARGYLNRPDLTSDRFIPHPDGTEGARLYKTGDLARFLPNGKIEHLGRSDYQVKIRGYRIELGEIESSLIKHSAVQTAVVVTWEDRPDDLRLVAYLSIVEGESVTTNECREYLRQTLPEFMIPSAFIQLPALPLTPNGKIDRQALPAPDLSQAATDTNYLRPQNETEQIISTIWQEILKIDRISIEANFFELGGHSLLMAQVSRSLFTALGRKVSIVDLFQYTTIRSLSQYLSTQHPAPTISAKSPRQNVRSAKLNTLTDGIAIIGMAGRFPGANNLDEYWANLRDGVESIAPLSDEQVQAAGISANLANDPNYVKVGAHLQRVDEFDAGFFGFNAREAQITDPQQRIYLESAWAALEDAGYPANHSNGYTIGVYGGTAPNTYLANNIRTQPDFAPGTTIDPVARVQLNIGNNPDYLSTRVAYKLNLTGPAITVQTACSTSLVAIHLACQSLMAGECDLALAGGAIVTSPQQAGYLYQQGLMLSPDGHCRPFDADAKGTVFGDGVGVVVLKPLAQAIADGDCIHAVIKGSAINNDGNLKVNYTAPSVAGQAATIAKAQANAGINPETVTYIEAHGTGTSLGDPIEIAGLTQAFRTKTDRTGYCAIGSVKSNIGHLDAASGIAGLIKTVLAMKHQQIPPSLNFERPNPEIDFANSPFYVNTQLSPWKTNGSPRRAGVSSFGFGGTNAHLILEEWNPPTSATTNALVQPSKQLLLLSAKTASALDTATANLAAHFQAHPQINLSDAAYTLATGRVGFHHRRIVVVNHLEDAIAKLTTPEPNQVFGNTGIVKPRSVVFMFSGQGSQYVNMARDLYQTQPYFKSQLDLCCDILMPHLGYDLRDILYPPIGRSAAATAQINQTAIAQPALFAIEYALAQLWISWGVTPVATIGHSIGEYVAATLAGVFSLADALEIVAVRGRLMNSLPSGSMLAVPLSVAEVRPLLAGTPLEVALINTLTDCVVSGETAAIAAFERQLATLSVEGRRLQTSHAFHSAMMEPILAAFTEKLQQVRLNPPTMPYISNVTGTWIKTAEATNPSYYAQHLRQTVRFAEGVAQLLSNPQQILLEVGPGRTLTTFVKRHPDRSPEQIVLNSIRHPQADVADDTFLLDTLGQLWLSGCELNWSEFYRDRAHTRVPLPTYPFERQSYWLEPNKQAQKVIIDRDKKPDIADWFYVPIWKASIVARSPRSLATPTLIFVDRSGFGKKLAQAISSQAGTVITVEIGKKFQQLGRDRYRIDPSQRSDYEQLIRTLAAENLIPQTILHLWSITANHHPKLSIETVDRTQTLGFYSLLYLSQSLEQISNPSSLKLLVISERLHNVTGAENICPAKSTILGAVRVIPQEYNHINCTSIDLVLPRNGSNQEQKLIAQLLSEIDQKSTDKIIAYRDNRRWVEIFEPLRLERKDPQTSQFKIGGIYLITGGLGGIGLVIAKYLATTFQAKLVLTGRSALPDRDRWQQWISEHDEGDIISEKISKVEELEALGAKVLVVRADVANLAQMQAAILATRKQFGQLNGVIHAAGLIDPQVFTPINKTSKTEVNYHFRPKITGTLVLAKLLDREKLDFCLVMSSISTLLGGLGYVGYAAANQFLNKWTQQQNQTSTTPWISINWDLWKVGKFDANTSLSQLAILPAEGMDAMTRLLSDPGIEQAIVSTGALQPRIDRWVKLVSLRSADPDSSPLSSPTQLSQSDDLQQNLILHGSGSVIEQKISQIWQKILGINNIGLNDDFFDLGGDSLLAVQLFNLIKQTFGRQLPLATLVQQRTIRELAELLKAEEAPAAKTWSSLVSIQTGATQNPPLFFIHPAGGNILEYYPLVKYMGREYPIYGLQSQGLDGKQPLLTRIEDMASHYIREIQTIQPDGPYLLIGYSMGATIAYEMAVQLAAQGQQVPLLAVLDQTAPNVPQARPSLLKVMSIHASNLSQLPSNRRLIYLKNRTLDKFQGLNEIDYLLGDVKRENINPELLNLIDANIASYESYTPKTYSGNMTIFRCKVQPVSDFIQPQLGWNRLVQGKIDVYPMDGDHFTLLREPFTRLMVEKLLFAIKSNLDNVVF